MTPFAHRGRRGPASGWHAMIPLARGHRQLAASRRALGVACRARAFSVKHPPSGRHGAFAVSRPA